MNSVHVFYDQASGQLYRRVAGDFPLVIGDAVFDDEFLGHEGWLICLVPNASEFSTRIPWERRGICINEPSAMNGLPVSYLNQFGLLISPFFVPGFKGRWFESHTGLPWFFGAKLTESNLKPTLTLNELKVMKPPEKSNTVSVVLSRKVFHDGHRKRLRLLELLKRSLGDRLLIYGRGIKEIDDKADAILPSKFHLSIENTVERSYWTEKLSDAFLGFALPVYGGCPNIHEWFPEDSMLTINPDDPDRACRVIQQAIENDVYEQRLPSIHDARIRVLSNETVFHVISRAISGQPGSESANLTSSAIRPPGKCGLKERLRREARRIFHQLTFRAQLDN